MAQLRAGPSRSGTRCARWRRRACHFTSSCCGVDAAPQLPVAFLGSGGALCTLVALAFQYYFEATLAMLLMVFSRYVLALQKERVRLELQWLSRQREDSAMAASAPCGASTPERSSLPGKAQEDICAAELDTNMLNDIVLASLAREHVRCTSAIKSYELPDGTKLSHTLRSRAAASSSDVIDRTRPRQVPSLSVGRCPVADLSLSASDGISGGTPRSPHGPPSPSFSSNQWNSRSDGSGPRLTRPSLSQVSPRAQMERDGHHQTATDPPQFTFDGRQAASPFELKMSGALASQMEKDGSSSPSVGIQRAAYSIKPAVAAPPLHLVKQS